MGITIEGLESTQTALKKIGDMTNDLMPKIMQDVVAQGVTHAKACVPRDTGALENSIEGEVKGKENIEGNIGAGSDNINLKSGKPTRDYACAVEDGWGGKERYGVNKGGTDYMKRTALWLEEYMHRRVLQALGRILQ